MAEKGLIENWVKLVPGVPKRLHFSAHGFMSRRITDPILNVPKDVSSLVFAVDREDGSPVSKSFSVVSEKLSGDLAGWVEGSKYVAYEFTLIKDAPGFVAPRIVSVEPFRA